MSVSESVQSVVCTTHVNLVESEEKNDGKNVEIRKITECNDNIICCSIPHETVTADAVFHGTLGKCFFFLWFCWWVSVHSLFFASSVHFMCSCLFTFWLFSLLLRPCVCVFVSVCSMSELPLVIISAKIVCSNAKIVHYEASKPHYIKPSSWQSKKTRHKRRLTWTTFCSV